MKRLWAVVFLIAVLTLVGYLSFSGSRFFKSGDAETCRGKEFYAEKADVYLYMDHEWVTVYGNDGKETDLKMMDGNDGILTFTDGDFVYRFVMLGEGALFDVQTRCILYEIH